MARFDVYSDNCAKKYDDRSLNASFDLFKNKILEVEGGFVNDPLDPGGATNKGITFNLYQSYPIDYDKDGQITVKDLKLLTDFDAHTIYYQAFWLPMFGNQISDQSFAELFIDHGINAGPSRAVKMLQYLLNTYYNRGLVQDGVMGNVTYGNLEKVLRQDARGLYDLYKSLRENYYLYRSYSTLTRPEFRDFLSTLITPNSTQQRFIQGWLNRLKKFEWKATVVTAGGILLLTIGGILLYNYIKS